MAKVTNVLTMMSGVVQSMKDKKEQKAEQAFYNYLDLASQDTVSLFQDNQQSPDKIQTVKKDAMGDSNSDSQLKNSDSKETVDKSDASGKADNQAFRTEENASHVEQKDAQAENVAIEEIELPEQDKNIFEAVSALLGMTAGELQMQVQALDVQLKDIVAEGLGISVDELEQLMQELNITTADLLETTDLMNVIMQSNGLEDVGMILTDENLFAQFKEISQEMTYAVDEFMQKYPVEDTKLQQMMQADEAQPLVIVETKTPVQAAVQSQVQMTTIQPRMQNETVDAERPSVDANAASDEMEASQITVTDKKQQFGGQSMAEEPDEHVFHYEQRSVTQGEQGTQREQGAAQGAQFVQQFVDNITQAAPAEGAYVTVDMEEIISQIVEQMKVQMSADSTSMEMQLNPESLGKVQIQVIVKDGAVTAQMAVENEAVKNALESQMVTLKENMNNQGVKVEAIEVTIASHEFERNLQQDNKESQQAFEQEQRNAARRRINLNLDDWQEEDLQQMTEAESLERKIMMQSGNRINFQA